MKLTKLFESISTVDLGRPMTASKSFLSMLDGELSMQLDVAADAHKISAYHAGFIIGEAGERARSKIDRGVKSLFQGAIYLPIYSSIQAMNLYGAKTYRGYPTNRIKITVTNNNLSNQLSFSSYDALFKQLITAIHTLRRIDDQVSVKDLLEDDGVDEALDGICRELDDNTSILDNAGFTSQAIWGSGNIRILRQVYMQTVVALILQNLKESD